jgi:hypothetical protein
VDTVYILKPSKHQKAMIKARIVRCPSSGTSLGSRGAVQFWRHRDLTSEASGDKNPEATGANSFIPSLELAIESAFASADTKSLDRVTGCDVR